MEFLYDKPRFLWCWNSAYNLQLQHLWESTSDFGSNGRDTCPYACPFLLFSGSPLLITWTSSLDKQKFSQRLSKSPCPLFPENSYLHPESVICQLLHFSFSTLLNSSCFQGDLCTCHSVMIPASEHLKWHLQIARRIQEYISLPKYSMTKTLARKEKDWEGGRKEYKAQGYLLSVLLKQVVDDHASFYCTGAHLLYSVVPSHYHRREML